MKPAQAERKAQDRIWAPRAGLEPIGLQRYVQLQALVVYLCLES